MRRPKSSTFLKISGRPRSFHGTVKLPPSKSYLHRALFVSALADSESALINCGTKTNDDIRATVRALRALGTKIKPTRQHGSGLEITPGLLRSNDVTLNAMGSGTTARFLIPFSALSPKRTQVTIVGNESLSNRPMETVFEPLSQLGVRVRSIDGNGKLPVLIEGGGIVGGQCEVDGSISSQFVSSLLISCVKAEKDTTISIENPEGQVSEPYIGATIQVMKEFGFKIRSERSASDRYVSFRIPGRQHIVGRQFTVPGDMSSGAALIGASIAARGQVQLTNTGARKFRQPDSAIVRLARQFGAKVVAQRNVIKVIFLGKETRKAISLDLRDSPDLVPTVAAVAAATGIQISISNIGHLRFKESDRISVLSRELSKIGIKTEETESTLRIVGSETEPKNNKTFIRPDADHRMLMAFAIAGLSGKFGTLYIEDPDCVKKSYPSFVADLQKLCHERCTLKIVNLRNLERIVA